MQTMNVVLPDSLTEYIQQQVVQLGYENAGDYFRELVEADQLRKEKLILALETEVIRGLECQERILMTDEVWNAMRQEVQDRLAAKSKSLP
jgi:Arc/MetJ-type ribon-helix-helix transcriptional regulator